MTLALGIVSFCGGLWLLVESVEGLVKALRGWAAAAGVSGLVLAALVLGFDIESTAAGAAAALADLPGTALGTSIGAAIFLLTAGLGIAALVAPFSVRTPPSLLAAAGTAAALAIALSADGDLSRADGGLLLAAFVPLVALVARALRDAPVGAVAAGRPKGLALRLAAGLAGLLLGAELLVLGTQRVVDELGVSETVFGLVVVAAAVSFEEVILEALPAYRGFPELSVGNALGTLLFLLTGSLGAIVLLHPLTVPARVVDYHLPALALSALLAGALLARGRLGRPEGALLLASYAAYATGAIAVGG
jgi:cation:H+ antiporter